MVQPLVRACSQQWAARGRKSDRSASRHRDDKKKSRSSRKKITARFVWENFLVRATLGAKPQNGLKSDFFKRRICGYKLDHPPLLVREGAGKICSQKSPILTKLVLAVMEAFTFSYKFPESGCPLRCDIFRAKLIWAAQRLQVLVCAVAL